jgi:hypothetical protein
MAYVPGDQITDPIAHIGVQAAADEITMTATDAPTGQMPVPDEVEQGDE